MNHLSSSVRLWTDTLILRRRLRTSTIRQRLRDVCCFLSRPSSSQQSQAAAEVFSPKLIWGSTSSSSSSVDDSRNTTTEEREIATDTTNYIWNWSVWFTQDQYYQGGSVFRWMWKKAICTFTLQITDAADLLKSLTVSAIITNQRMSPGGAEWTSY